DARLGRPGGSGLLRPAARGDQPRMARDPRRDPRPIGRPGALDARRSGPHRGGGAGLGAPDRARRARPRYRHRGPGATLPCLARGRSPGRHPGWRPRRARSRVEGRRRRKLAPVQPDPAPSVGPGAACRAALPGLVDQRWPPLPSRMIYLASRSPRRQELLARIGVRFEVLAPAEDEAEAAEALEALLPGERPSEYVLRVTLAKARAGERSEER